MDKYRLDEIIQNISSLTNAEVVFDDYDDIDLESEVDLILYSKSVMGVTVSEDFSRISIYVSFSFEDYRSEEIAEGRLDPEELQIEQTNNLLHNFFILWAQDKEIKYPISVWDDGAYMCPGYEARIGYYNIPYKDEAILSFVKLCDEFFEKFGNIEDKEIRKNIVAILCRKYGLFIELDDCIALGSDAKLTFTDYREIIDNNVEKYYIGAEYAIFNVDGKNYASISCVIKLFYEAFENCESYDRVTSFYDGRNLTLCSEHMTLTLIVSEDKGIYSNSEEMRLLVKTIPFIPFASTAFREVFYLNFSESISKNSEGRALIFTEGYTDYVHLENQWNHLEKEYDNIKFDFWDFDKKNSGMKYVQNMGSSELLEMCKSFSKVKQNKIMIFIADCDVPNIVKEMAGNLPNGYKSWGNNVFSFTLPIPKHRMGETGICIEHLYTDSDIKRPFKCKDGKTRRLYLGNDFDKYGRNITEKLLCMKRSLCGADSIKIIDGSSDARVLSYETEDETNYALSKMDFAHMISNCCTSESREAFRSVFDIIFKIFKEAGRN